MHLIPQFLAVALLLISCSKTATDQRSSSAQNVDQGNSKLLQEKNNESAETLPDNNMQMTPIFVENTQTPKSACDAVKWVCGTEAASVGLNVVLGATGAGGLINCAKEMGINLPFDAAAVAGMDSVKDLADLAGEKICDLAGCFPPLEPVTISIIGSCHVYNSIKGVLNCYIAKKECDMEKLETPPDQHGACANSSVMACVNDVNGSRPTTADEIAIQCRNMARRYRYNEGSSQFQECVNNCISMTQFSQDTVGCGVTPTPTNTSTPPRTPSAMPTPSASVTPVPRGTLTELQHQSTLN